MGLLARDRVIAGLALPYGVLISANRRRFRFAHGCSMGWPDPVRLLREHDRALRLGRAVALTNTRGGLLAALAVDPGRRGDRALARVVDGAERGLSAGVDFIDYGPDPEQPGVLLVRRAWLREITLTRTPAAPGAWVTFWPGR